MQDLGFTLIYRPHSPGFTVPFIQSDAGVLRRATEEEAVLWGRLTEMQKQLDEHRQPARGRK